MYIDLPTFKAYMGITVPDDDTLLNACIGRAAAALDAACGRTFAASADSTRRFDALRDVSGFGRTLYLGDDLCAITSIVNGDGTTIPLSAIVTEPRGRAPYYALTLKTDSDLTWTYPDAPEDAIAITGRWAYSLTPPPDVAHACLRLAAYFYRQKDTHDALAPAAASRDAVLTLPARLPLDVQALIAPYRRLTP
jgi:hypothetical protein